MIVSYGENSFSIVALLSICSYLVNENITPQPNPFPDPNYPLDI